MSRKTRKRHAARRQGAGGSREALEREALVQAFERHRVRGLQSHRHFELRRSLDCDAMTGERRQQSIDPRTDQRRMRLDDHARTGRRALPPPRRSRASGTARGSKKLPALYSFMPSNRNGLLAQRGSRGRHLRRNRAGAACPTRSCTSTSRTSRSATDTRVRSAARSPCDAAAVRVALVFDDDALVTARDRDGGRAPRRSSTKRSRAARRRRVASPMSGIEPLERLAVVPLRSARAC